MSYGLFYLRQRSMQRSFLDEIWTGIVLQLNFTFPRFKLPNIIEGKRVVHIFIAQRNKSQTPGIAWSSISHSREIPVLTSWTFRGRFDRVPNTLAFVLLGLLLSVLVQLSWVTTRTVALSWGNHAVCLSSGSVVHVCCYHSLCLLGSAFDSRCFFGRLLLIGSCYGVDNPLHSLWSYSPVHCY